MSLDANSFLMSGGVPAAKFAQPGASISGTILLPPELRQQTNFDTGAPLTWDDGQPRMQVVVQLATSERDPADPADDGTRALYIKGNLLSAIRTAVRKAGARELEVGGELTVTYARDGVAQKRGMHPPKVYTATYAPPAAQPAAVLENAGLAGRGDDDKPPF